MNRSEATPVHRSRSTTERPGGPSVPALPELWAPPPAVRTANTAVIRRTSRRWGAVPVRRLVAL